MQQLSKQPAFELGQIVATPGALAALKKAGQQPEGWGQAYRFIALRYKKKRSELLPNYKLEIVV